MYVCIYIYICQLVQAVLSCTIWPGPTPVGFVARLLAGAPCGSDSSDLPKMTEAYKAQRLLLAKENTCTGPHSLTTISYAAPDFLNTGLFMSPSISLSLPVYTEGMSKNEMSANSSSSSLLWCRSWSPSLVGHDNHWQSTCDSRLMQSASCWETDSSWC